MTKRGNKLIAIFVAVIMSAAFLLTCFSVFSAFLNKKEELPMPNASFENHYNFDPASFYGTYSTFDEFKIYSYLGLVNFARTVSDGYSYEGKTVYLSQDIDCSGGNPFLLDYDNGGYEPDELNRGRLYPIGIAIDSPSTDVKLDEWDDGSHSGNGKSGYPIHYWTENGLQKTSEDFTYSKHYINWRSDYPDDQNGLSDRNKSTSFAGTFDGCGFAIKNYIMVRSGHEMAVTDGWIGFGLFANLIGTVKNLELNNFEIYNLGCFSNQDVGGSGGTAQDRIAIGAIAGFMQDSKYSPTISNCKVEDFVITNYNCAAGNSSGLRIGSLVGSLVDYGKTTISDCYVAKSVIDWRFLGVGIQSNLYANYFVGYSNANVLERCVFDKDTSWMCFTKKYASNPKYYKAYGNLDTMDNLNYCSKAIYRLGNHYQPITLDVTYNEVGREFNFTSSISSGCYFTSDTSFQDLKATYYGSHSSRMPEKERSYWYICPFRYDSKPVLRDFVPAWERVSFYDYDEGSAEIFEVEYFDGYDCSYYAGDYKMIELPLEDDEFSLEYRYDSLSPYRYSISENSTIIYYDDLPIMKISIPLFIQYDADEKYKLYKFDLIKEYIDLTSFDYIIYGDYGVDPDYVKIANEFYFDYDYLPVSSVTFKFDDSWEKTEIKYYTYNQETESWEREDSPNNDLVLDVLGYYTVIFYSSFNQDCFTYEIANQYKLEFYIRDDIYYFVKDTNNSSDNFATLLYSSIDIYPTLKLKQYNINLG